MYIFSSNTTFTRALKDRWVGRSESWNENVQCMHLVQQLPKTCSVLQERKRSFMP